MFCALQVANKSACATALGRLRRYIERQDGGGRSLPAGWTCRMFRRSTGATAGTTDKYFYSPACGGASAASCFEVLSFPTRVITFMMSFRLRLSTPRLSGRVTPIFDASPLWPRGRKPHVSHAME